MTFKHNSAISQAFSTASFEGFVLVLTGEALVPTRLADVANAIGARGLFLAVVSTRDWREWTSEHAVALIAATGTKLKPALSVKVSGDRIQIANDPPIAWSDLEAKLKKIPTTPLQGATLVHIGGGKSVADVVRLLDVFNTTGTDLVVLDR